VRERQDRDTAASPADSDPFSELADVLFEFSVWTRSKALQNELARLSGIQLERSAYSILSELNKVGPLRAMDLVALLGMDQSTLSRRISALRADGLVESLPNQSDARSTYLSLTARGRAVLDRTRRYVVQQHAAMLASWTDDEIAELSNTLRKFIESVSEYIVSLDDRASTP
jgi:DNA-binding MarR family transcriptional regulator